MALYNEFALQGVKTLRSPPPIQRTSRAISTTRFVQSEESNLPQAIRSRRIAAFLKGCIGDVLSGADVRRQRSSHRTGFSSLHI